MLYFDADDAHAGVRVLLEGAEGLARDYLSGVSKPTEPGKPQKWRITCDYRELNKVIRNHAYPLPDVTETIRAVREQACESHRQDLENGVDNPDIPEGVDPKGHDPGVSFISVGDLAKAFYHMPVASTGTVL